MSEKKITIAKENTCVGRMFYYLVKISRPLIRWIWIKEIKGLENIPSDGPVIVVANHQSYLDFICLIAALPRQLTFLAAEKFFTSRSWRPLVEYTGQIKVERQAQDKGEAIEKALAVLRSGRILALFPQGTRSRDGQIGKYFCGVARLAQASGAPVVPVAIKNAFALWPPHQPKPKLKKTIEMVILPPINFAHAASSENFQIFTDQVMDQIKKFAER